MTPIKWLIIAWGIQTILLLVLIFDLHARLTNIRKFLAAMCGVANIEVKTVLAIIEKADEMGIKL